MKEAVPGNKPLEALSKGERPHVCHQPFAIREALAAQSDKCRRGVDAQHVKPVVDEIACDRFTMSAADVENARACRQQRNKAIQPTALDAEIAAAIGVVVMRASRVERHDPICMLTHERQRGIPVVVAPSSRRARCQKCMIAAPDDGSLAALLSPLNSRWRSADREGPAFGCPTITLGSGVQLPELGIDTSDGLVNRCALASRGLSHWLLKLTQTPSSLRLPAQP